MMERSWCISEKSGEAGERSPASSVEGGAADTEVLGDGDFGFTGSGPPTASSTPSGVKARLRPLYLPAFFAKEMPSACVPG